MNDPTNPSQSLLPFTRLLATVPGLAQLRRAALGTPVVAFQGRDRLPRREVLQALAQRALIVADADAAPALDDRGTRADVVVLDAREPGNGRRPPGGRLASVGPPEMLSEPGDSAPWPVLLLPDELSWLADALGHGASSMPGSGNDVLLVALCFGPAPMLWVGPQPSDWRGLLTGLRLSAPHTEILVERRAPSWYPEQGRADLVIVADAWATIDRGDVARRLRDAASKRISVQTDLVPGRVARAALARARSAGSLADEQHEAWIEFGRCLHRELKAGATRVENDVSEADKYRAFWAQGRQAGHSSPGEHVYPLVRQYVRSLGCRSFLDLGCGAGEVMLAAAADGMDVAGVDIADGLSELARPRLRKRLALGCAWQLPFADDSVDFVFSSDVFEHLPPSRLEASLSELHRVCHRGAALAISARADVTGMRWGALLHLSVFPLDFWKESLAQHFEIPYATETGHGDNPHYIILLRKKVREPARAPAKQPVEALASPDRVSA